MTSVHERVTRLLEGIGQNRRTIIGPEGVPLPVDVAESKRDSPVRNHLTKVFNTSHRVAVRTDEYNVRTDE